MNQPELDNLIVSMTFPSTVLAYADAKFPVCSPTNFLFPWTVRGKGERWGAVGGRGETFVEDPEQGRSGAVYGSPRPPTFAFSSFGFLIFPINKSCGNHGKATIF